MGCDLSLCLCFHDGRAGQGGLCRETSAPWWGSRVVCMDCYGTRLSLGSEKVKVTILERGFPSNLLRGALLEWTRVQPPPVVETPKSVVMVMDVARPVESSG